VHDVRRQFAVSGCALRARCKQICLFVVLHAMHARGVRYNAMPRAAVAIINAFVSFELRVSVVLV